LRAAASARRQRAMAWDGGRALGGARLRTWLVWVRNPGERVSVVFGEYGAIRANSAEPGIGIVPGAPRRTRPRRAVFCARARGQCCARARAVSRSAEAQRRGAAAPGHFPGEPLPHCRALREDFQVSLPHCRSARTTSLMACKPRACARAGGVRAACEMRPCVACVPLARSLELQMTGGVTRRAWAIPTRALGALRPSVAAVAAPPAGGAHLTPKTLLPRHL
jgi:hypothetical protein